MAHVCVAADSHGTSKEIGDVARLTPRRSRSASCPCGLVIVTLAYVKCIFEF